MTDFWNNQKPERALQKLVGKGLRITAYTGFDAERVVIPPKIGGLPVVSIGEKVFKNTTVSEVILPGSSIVVSILSRATQHSIRQYRTALFWFS